MGRPRTSAKILELRGAFKKNPARRRYEMIRSPPLNTEPDSTWPPALQEAWTRIVESAPDGVLKQMDRQTVRIAAQLEALLDRYEIDDPMYSRLERALWRYRLHLGLTPLARMRFVR